MKKFLYLLPAIALLLSACSQKSQLNGKFANGDNDGKQVYLLTMKDFNAPFQPVDSTIIKDGAFSFDLNDSTEVGVAYVVVKEPAPGTPNGIPFVYEKGNIEMYIDSVPKVKGTPLNEKSQAFFDKLAVVAKKMETLDAKAAQVTDPNERQGYIDEMQGLQKEMSTIGYDFVKENMSNRIGEFYLVSFIDLFDDNQVQDLLKLASPEYQKLINNLLGLDDQPQAQQGSLIGKKFIDITGTTPDGKTISISEYAGKDKVILVDFWASWCGPCIKEMPNVVAAYQKYKSKGFEIVGISLDDDKSKWTAAIKNLNMAWPQMSDLKGWDSQLSAPYNVTSIPYTVLIDKDGTIVAENLRGQELDKKLSELLK